MHPSEELWISRALDRRASAAEWRELDAVAAHDSGVWLRLANTLRAEAALGEHFAAAFGDELSTSLPAGVATLRDAPRGRRSVRLAGAVAALLLTFVAGFGLGTGSSDGVAGCVDRDVELPAPAPGAEQLLASYLQAGRESGRVLQHLPLRTVATRALPDGDGVEVVFVRSFVERTQVDRAVTLANDEHGRPQPLAVDLTNYFPPANF